MNWFIKFFVRKRVADFIQNYNDCPANWILDDTYSNRLKNVKHQLMIELTTSRTNVYRFYPGSETTDENNLNWAERRILVKTFKNVANSELPIPTKLTHPEDFI